MQNSLKFIKQRHKVQFNGEIHSNLTQLWRLDESFLDAERHNLEKKYRDKTDEKKLEEKQSFVHIILRGYMHNYAYR